MQLREKMLSGKAISALKGSRAWLQQRERESSEEKELLFSLPCQLSQLFLTTSSMPTDERNQKMLPVCSRGCGCHLSS